MLKLTALFNLQSKTQRYVWEDTNKFSQFVFLLHCFKSKINIQLKIKHVCFI